MNTSQQRLRRSTEKNVYLLIFLGKSDTKTNYSLAAECLRREQQRQDVKLLQADKEEKSIFDPNKIFFGIFNFPCWYSPWGLCMSDVQQSERKLRALWILCLPLGVDACWRLFPINSTPERFPWCQQSSKSFLYVSTLCNSLCHAAALRRVPTKTFVRTWIVFSVPLGLHWD